MKSTLLRASIVLCITFFTSIFFWTNNSAAQEAENPEKYLEAYNKGDYDTAFKGMMLQAEEGSADGQYVVGQMFFSGKGTTKNDIEAAKWFRKAAEQGHPLAQHQLAMLYAKGMGVEADMTRAYVWSSLAAKYGKDPSVRSAELASRLEEVLTPQQLSQGKKEVANWVERIGKIKAGNPASKKDGKKPKK